MLFSLSWITLSYLLPYMNQSAILVVPKLCIILSIAAWLTWSIIHVTKKNGTKISQSFFIMCLIGIASLLYIGHLSYITIALVFSALWMLFRYRIWSDREKLFKATWFYSVMLAVLIPMALPYFSKEAIIRGANIIFASSMLHATYVEKKRERKACSVCWRWRLFRLVAVLVLIALMITLMLLLVHGKPPVFDLQGDCDLTL